MRRADIINALALALLVGACDDTDGLTEVTETSATASRDVPFDIDANVGGSLIAELETPTGSRLQFIELTAGKPGGILIVEEGDEGTLVADRIFETAGGVVNAAELYSSLIDPADPDARVPQRILELSKAPATPRPMGWALNLVKQVHDSPLLSTASLASSATIACNNANFTGSIGGGFLARTKKRLDTGPKLHPSLWPSYTDNNGPWPSTAYTLYYYRTVGWATNTPLWKGKVCGNAGRRPAPTRPSDQFTYVLFLYRYGGKWWEGGFRPFYEDEGTKVATWYYDGGLGRIDWDITIVDAALSDEFDVLMTFN